MHQASTFPALYRNILPLMSADDSEVRVRHDTLESLAGAWGGG
jgi:hypothetical protein